MFAKRNRLGIALVALTLILALAGFAAANTPAGTKISNQATATYKAGDVERVSASNVVYVTVKQVAGVVVGPTGDESRNVVAGQVVQHVYTVKNTGNGPDTFTLSTVLGTDSVIDESDVEWYHDVNGNGVINSGEPTVTEIALAAGEEANLIARFTIPANAQVDEELELALEVESKVDDQMSVRSQPVTYTVVESDVVTALLERSPGETDAGEKMQYTLRVTNQTTKTISTVKAEIGVPANTEFVAGSLVVHGVDQTDPAKFPADVDIKNLSAGQTAVITYAVKIDDSAPAGYIENRVSVEAGANKFDSNRVRTLVRFSAGVDVTYKDGDGLEVEDAKVGHEYTFTYTVKNEGNGDDAFEVQPTIVDDNGDPVNWPVRLYKSDGVTPLSREDGKYTTGTVPADGSTHIVVKVLVPTNAKNNTAPYTLETTVTSKTDPTEKKSVTAKFKNIVEADVTVTVDKDGRKGEPNPGQTVEYPVTIKNDGPTEDTFDLDHDEFPRGTVVEFVDKDGNPITEVTADPGEEVEVFVRITIPDDAEPKGDVGGKIVVTSQNDPDVKKTVEIEIEANDYINFTVEPDRVAAVNQGSFSTYEFTITNSGNSEKTFDLDIVGGNRLDYQILDGDATALTSIKVDKGTSATFKVRIDASYAVSVGWTEAVEVTAKTGGETRSASLTTTVIGSELTMTKTADVTEQAPGGNIVYTITVENISTGPLMNVVIYDAIPQHTEYVSHDAGGATVEVEFSDDGGASWDNVRANVGTVTNVRWLVGNLAVGATVEVELTVKVK